MIHVLLERVDKNEKLTEEQKEDRKMELKCYWYKNCKKIIKYEKKILLKKNSNINSYFKFMGNYYQLMRILIGAETIPFMPGNNFISDTTEFVKQLHKDTKEWYAENADKLI